MKMLVRVLASLAIPATLTLCLAPARTDAQASAVPPGASAIRSHSSGFFVGLGYEGDGSQVNQSGSSVESGSGGGLVLGYGFNAQWALYGESSGATMNAADGGTYSLEHLDLGVRRHFRTGPNVVVPFIQFGFSGRAEQETVGLNAVSASGGGISAGAGLNAHFTPSFAFSGAVTWAFGNFDNFQVNNATVASNSVNVITTRIHLGVIWFPGA